MKFTKKPIEVEAYQITKSLLENVLFDDGQYPKGLQMTRGSYNKERREIHSWVGQVTTINNQETKVVEGDWIITEPNLINHYSCKHDIFVKTYDQVL